MHFKKKRLTNCVFNIGDYHEYAKSAITDQWYWTFDQEDYYGPYKNKHQAKQARQTAIVRSEQADHVAWEKQRAELWKKACEDMKNLVDKFAITEIDRFGYPFSYSAAVTYDADVLLSVTEMEGVVESLDIKKVK